LRTSISKNLHLGPQNGPEKLKPAKNSKLPKLPENCFEPVGKGGWPPISTWIIESTDITKIPQRRRTSQSEERSPTSDVMITLDF
jgi:hypothetical protein